MELPESDFHSAEEPGGPREPSASDFKEPGGPRLRDELDAPVLPDISYDLYRLHGVLNYSLGSIPSHLEMGSAPFERSAKGTTLCSATTGTNFESVGMRVPRGKSAMFSMNWYLEQPDFKNRVIKDLPNNQAYLSALLTMNSFYPYVDLFLKGRGEKGRQYGHRAMAFCSKDDGQWYVFDPYTSVNGPLPENSPERLKPIPIESYLSKREVVAMVPIDHHINDYPMNREYLPI